ncbi:cytochrome b [Sphingomonas sp. AOB5]|uniref:cytochrome b n=1 Tax=Sphingomonas sp. AOB5 TaxID=3034017 RepID=UPI0023F9D2B1|nr:cytochrome b [Sphingomonas sp. AOB5]MDF7776403.1 cytochrome b [Sphingomonas sp. AOB5]
MSEEAELPVEAPIEFPAEEPDSYSRGAIMLHWITAALVLSTIPLGWFGASFESAAAQTATNAHKLIGMAILALTLARIGWRIAHRPPPYPDAIGPRVRLAAKIVHSAIYALLVILPLTGWWMSSAVPKRHPIGFEGVIELPFLPIAQSWASAGPAHALHVNLGWVMVALALLHIGAALKHHFVDRDTVLLRMTRVRKR